MANKEIHCEYIDADVKIVGNVCWVRGSCYKYMCPYKLGIPDGGADE